MVSNQVNLKTPGGAAFKGLMSCMDPGGVGGGGAWKGF